MKKAMRLKALGIIVALPLPLAAFVVLITLAVMQAVGAVNLELAWWAALILLLPAIFLLGLVIYVIGSRAEAAAIRNAIIQNINDAAARSHERIHSRSVAANGEPRGGR